MKSLVIFLILITGCYPFNKTCSIGIKNQSKITLDSVVIQVNNYKQIIALLPAGLDTIIRMEEKDVNTKHDVVFGFTGYANGLVISREVFFSNDLGYLPEYFNVIFSPYNKFVIDTTKQ